MITNKLRCVKTVSTQSKETIVERKRRLRAYMKERRGENENRDVKESLLVENVLHALEEKCMGTDKRCFVYLAFSSEAPTDKLVEALLERDWKVYCPRVEGKRMVAVEYAEDFALSKFGIREPIGLEYKGELDVAIIPMLAVDDRGRRLGYGGGYYDRFLAEHDETLRLAYGFDFQIVRQVPTEDHDGNMDGIVTDKRVLWTSARADI